MTVGAALLVGSSCATVAPPPAANTEIEALPTAAGVPFRFEETKTFCDRPGDNTLTSVVRVASADGADASGVVIARNRVLTAAHVVEDFVNASVFINGAYRDARVIARDARNDLALLWTETQNLEPIRISSSHLFSAEPVWTVGFPLAKERTANAGRYEQLVDGAIHSTAGTNAGASGGGLLRCLQGHFELAGMIRGYGAYWRDGQLIRLEDLSISVPADTIADFAYQAGVSL